MTSGATERFVDALIEALGREAVSVDVARRHKASQDHAWLSPVLSARLPATVADVVVTPRTAEQLRCAIGLAHRHRHAVQPRGKGTGNYGQCVPFARGMVIDTDRLARIHDVGPGWIDADAGVSFLRLEAAARAHGQELAMFPTTVGSSLGGFLAGGAGGIGSVEHGFLWDGRFVDRVEVMGCWDEPETFAFEGSDAAPFLHTYGTTAVLARATVRLVPARRWTALLAHFARYEDAIATARALTALEPVPRAVGVTDPELMVWFPPDPAWPPGRYSLRAIIDRSTVAAAGALVAEGHGVPAAGRDDAVATVVSAAFNHVTLRAKQRRAELCHLQVGGDALVANAERVRATLPEGALHHDLFAGGVGGLLLSRFVDERTLYDGVAALRELGVHVVDPHTWLLGAHGGLEGAWQAAARFDPDGLLNPGKLPPPA